MSMLKHFLPTLLFFSIPVVAIEVSPNLGKAASDQQLSQWNKDIFPDGQGLPKGKGTSSYGKKSITNTASLAMVLRAQVAVLMS